MAGNPCYILTITNDVKKNDIPLSAQASAEASGKIYKKNQNDSSTQSTVAKDAQESTAPAEGSAAAAANDANPDTKEAAKEEQQQATGEKPSRRKPKQVIFLTSRVHPGESPAQFLIHGAIEFLLQ